MTGRARARRVLLGSIVLAAAAGAGLLTVPRFWERLERARRPRRAKKPRRAPKMATPPPILSPEATREARAEAIRRSIEELREECQRAANGDWDRWSAQNASVREELRAKIAKLKPLHPDATGTFEARAPIMEGRDGFALFEPSPQHYLEHLIEPASVDTGFGRGESVIAATQWLRRRGIDVVFVTVPKMTEVYPERFLDHVPPDGILDPHIRRVLLRLLEADVEAIDMLRPLRRERDADPDPLYQAADPHWGPRGQSIAARVIAERLFRYDFVARAQAEPPNCLWDRIPYRSANEGVAFPALTPEQQRRALAGHPRTTPYPKDCAGPLYRDSAQVVCIGDSYNAGFTDHLARELNLPVRNLSGGGYTTQAFREFLREPEMLETARVIVWTVCYPDLARPWPIPRPILESVGDRSGSTRPRDPVKEPAK